MNAFFSKPSLNHQIHESLLIGFHAYGPTLTFSGRLLSPKKVFLVDHISISLILPGQADQKHFDWFSLQTQDSSGETSCSGQGPSKFVLSPDSPYPYTIMFVDNDRYAEMKSVTQNIVSAWQEYHHQHAAAAGEVFDAFYQLPLIREMERILQGLCYWIPGKYFLTISVTTKQDTFQTKKSFFLNDTCTLQNNARQIIAQCCGLPPKDYLIDRVLLTD